MWYELEQMLLAVTVRNYDPETRRLRTIGHARLLPRSSNATRWR
jgi:hypothetical protein